MDDARDPRTAGGSPDDAGDAGATPPPAASPQVPGGTSDAGAPAPSDADATIADALADAAVARVRSADPAAGVEPDTAVLQARLAALGAPAGGTTAVPGDELTAARARRRGPARWLQVAAVAAGVALAGGGGYAVGAAGDGGAAPPIALGGAGGAQDMAMTAEYDRMALPAWGGRTVFHGRGLTGAAGTARAWAFDATGVPTAGTAARVAAVLGVEGEPRQEWGQWVVGPNDGTGATLQVAVDGQASLWFYDQRYDPGRCEDGVAHTLDGQGAAGTEPQLEGGAGQESGALEGGPAVEGGAPADEGAAAPADEGTTAPDGAVAAPDAEPLPEPVEPTDPLPAPRMPDEPAPLDPSVCDPGSTPRGDAAVARAREVVASLGVDVAPYEFTVDEETGLPGLVSVTGAQVVDGTQTGLGWSVQLAGDGVQSVSGPLAELVELGTYDHVSADEAVERLNDPRFGASYGGVMPLARMENLAGDASVEAPEPTVPPVPRAGDPVAWPVQEVTLTKARLGVTQLWTPTGALVLVPAWELTDTDGGTWSVIAVVEDQLDLSAD